MEEPELQKNMLFHTVPLTIFYHQFQFLIGLYAAADISLEKEMKMMTTILFDDKQQKMPKE